jgi:hypothetical protein
MTATTRPDTCTRCGKRHLTEPVMLELNTRTNRYRRAQDPAMDAAHSQGWFPFGRKCAAAQLRDQDRGTR